MIVNNREQAKLIPVEISGMKKSANDLSVNVYKKLVLDDVDCDKSFKLLCISNSRKNINDFVYDSSKSVISIIVDISDDIAYVKNVLNDDYYNIDLSDLRKVLAISDKSLNIPTISLKDIIEYLRFFNNNEKIMSDVCVEYDNNMKLKTDTDGNVIFLKLKQQLSFEDIESINDTLESVLVCMINLNSGNVSHKAPAITARLQEIRNKLSV